MKLFDVFIESIRLFIGVCLVLFVIAVLTAYEIIRTGKLPVSRNDKGKFVIDLDKW